MFPIGQDEADKETMAKIRRARRYQAWRHLQILIIFWNTIRLHVRTLWISKEFWRKTMMPLSGKRAVNL